MRCHIAHKRSERKAMGYPPWKSAMDRVLSWALWVLTIPVMLIAMALILVLDPGRSDG